MIEFSTDLFVNKYKGTRKFTEESEYYCFFVNSLKADKELFDHIKFCNDYLRIPPIYVFARYHKDTFDSVMTTAEKRGLGACFGYLFQNMWGYKAAVSTWVGDKTTGIKNASYFVKQEGI